MYQIAWARRLSLMLGVTFQAVSLVLAVFMGGLALGAWWLGRRADTSPSPLRLYGGLELGIAALGAASPFLLDALSALYVELHRGAALPAEVLPPLRLLLTAAVLLPPTTLMGATLPVLIRAVCGSPERVARASGLLYAVNTLGAAAGTLFAAFFLVEAVGIRGSIGFAAALNAAMGLAALALARGARAAAPRAGSPAAAADPPPEPMDASTARAVTAAFGVSGFLALAYEVLWTRYLIYVVGENSVYAFATVLAAFLIGIVLGSLAAAAVGDRLRDRVGALGAVLVLTGSTALGTLALMGFAAAGGSAASPQSFGSASLLRFLRCLAVLIAPTTLSGATLPLVTRIVARDPARFGGDAGRALAVNTLGGILGALAGGFWILPQLGLQGGLIGLAGVHVAVGMALLLRPRPEGRAWAAGALLALAALGGLSSALLQGHPLRRSTRDHELLFFADGAEATIAILRNRRGGELQLLFDGDNQASTTPLSQIHLRLLGHLPALFHPAPRDALVIGFGAGMSAGSLSRYPGLRVDVVELLRPVIEGAVHFAPHNGDPLASPDVHVHFGDGRNHLLTTRRRYDVITSDATDPDDAGVTNLYSREFFALARARLREGGVVSQWLSARYDDEMLRLVVRTFLSAFPDASLWRAGYTFILVGARDGGLASPAAVRRKFEEPGVAAHLAAVGIASAEELLALYVGGPDALRAWAGEGPLNTDDRPIVEYRLPRWTEARRSGLSRRAGEAFLAMRTPDLSAWLPGWSDAETRRMSGEFEIASAVLERNMVLRPRVDDLRLGPAPGVDGGAPYLRDAATREALARRYLDLTWQVLAGEASGVALIETGLFRPEPEPGAPPERVARYRAALREGREAFRRGEFAQARRRFAATARAFPAALRPALLEAASLDRMDRPGATLVTLLSLDLSDRHPEVNRDWYRLCEASFHAVLHAMRVGGPRARALGRLLRELTPPAGSAPAGRDAPPRPDGAAASDPDAWWSWWRAVRPGLRESGGRFRWQVF